jgi:hypothetical protein
MTTSPCSADVQSASCKENVRQWCRVNGDIDRGCLSLSRTSATNTPSPSGSTGSSGPGFSSGSSGPAEEYCPFTSVGITPCDADSECKKTGFASPECRVEIVRF